MTINLRAVMIAASTCATLFLAGCATSRSVQGQCYVEGGSSGIREAHCRVTIQEKSLSGGALDLAGFDAGAFYLDFSSSLSTPAAGTYSAEIVLMNGGQIVAAQSFPMQVSGFSGSVVSPGAVNAWMRGYQRMADTFEVEVESRFFEQPGANSVTFEVVYGSAPVTGWSHAWYVGGNGGPGNGQTY